MLLDLHKAIQKIVFHSNVSFLMPTTALINQMAIFYTSELDFQILHMLFVCWQLMRYLYLCKIKMQAQMRIIHQPVVYGVLRVQGEAIWGYIVLRSS